MSAIGEVYRLSTGETFPFERPVGIPQFDDGEKLTVAVPNGFEVELDDQMCPRISRGHKDTFLVELGNRPTMGLRRITAKNSSQTFHLDISTVGGIEAEKRLSAAIEDVEKWMPRTRGNFWYLEVDRSARRSLDPTRTLTFAYDNLFLIEKLIAEASRSPALRRKPQTHVSPFGGALDAEATRKLLTSQPDLLEIHPLGPIHSNGLSYAPKLTVRSTPSSDLHSTENLNLSGFLVALRQACIVALKRCQWLDKNAVQKGEKTCRVLAKLKHQTFLAHVPSGNLPNKNIPPVGLEVSHNAYRRLRALRVEFQSHASYPNSGPTNSRRHLASADRVFQAWSCHLIAKSLGLSETKLGIRSTDGVAFQSSEWRLYYDTYGVVETWRDASFRPVKMRPDILLQRSTDPSRIILVDAKYTVASAAEIPEERLKEIHAYMNAFGVKKIGVIHPGMGTGFQSAIISGHGMQIFDISAVPGSIVAEAEMNAFRDLLLSLECESGELFG